ncbi:Septation initiation network scaffold protein cdc11 [Colletotrichum tanaceti]|uniref:Septation initiation network scaffold protein cdc11 n=1 Tax=Colletotrichum tanaceti TaxID=1306861 RepID=A0A4U6XEA7_9PEZI|nr:Septation initiation network scaffold protein cdc11 [Colletotrichum tanaceti]KAJ0167217.1 Septation initiation network scaffold protein cdc11 [Colletotrichum tanaceti]TKW53995.1 Septation initiation network scaffold protein cdc11 [Colletotrichum tanaceti]
MAAHAWLDSLSEDWPSQAGSDTSPSAQLPPLKPAENNKTPNAKGSGSRIPLPVSRTRPSSAGTSDKSAGVLSERSSNHVNLPLSQRGPSKLSREIKPNEQSRQTSRALSASTNGSVIQHKSVKSSPLRGPADTPEWKRRLVYGDVAYGEQRDLFCSAAAGLENMFKPPSPHQDSTLADQSVRHNTTLPSSPPFFRRQDTDEDEDEDGSDGRSQMDPSPSPSPRIRPPHFEYKPSADNSIDQSKLSEPSPYRDSSPREPSLATSVSGLAPSNDATRKPSGQSVIRNEDFSPIVLTLMRQKENEGQCESAPAELPVDQLQDRLEKLRIDQMLLDSQSELRFDADGTLDDAESDKMETTEDYARRGGFLNMRRGGRSGDGSFRYRGLSPGMGVDTSEMLPEESLQASTPKQFPSVRTYSPVFTSSVQHETQSPPPPRAPNPSPEKSGTAGTSSTSPLKLFGPYDTFTNQTLLRRISQFEEQMSGSSRQSLSRELSQQTGRRRPHTAPGDYLSVPAQQTAASSRSVSQFGAGDLEGYQFNQGISIRLEEDSQFQEAEEELQHLPEEDKESVIRAEAVPGSPTPDEASMFVPRKRAKSGTTTASSSKHTPSGSEGSVQKIPFAGSTAFMLGTPRRRDTGSEGKRPRTSPSKDPTPKRRRTLHKSDIAYGREERYALLDTVQETHALMQSMMGKKRKDARPGSLQQRAHPTVLATRHMLRPRTPTPSSRSSLQPGEFSFEDDWLDDQLDDQPQRRSPHRGSQYTSSANERSATIDTDRKPSIRTQDFLDEAGKIMAMIRNGAKAPSGLTSVEESDAEYGEPSQAVDEDSFDSTREPLSRPPSREGKPVQRAPQRQENPEILDYLKKYQELSDMGDVITSSLRSMDEAQDAIRVAQEVERQLEERSRSRNNNHKSDGLQYLGGDETISDPPNIRISANPRKQRDDSDGFYDFGTHSSGASSNHTMHTGSSRGSESRKTIAPQSVSHLIPDQVGSMYLDRQQNIWIKRKGGSIRPRSPHVVPSEDSEDDPFASIPDLSVDITKEMQHLRLVTAQKEAEEREANRTQSPMASAPDTPRNASGRGFVTLSPDAALPQNIGLQARTEFRKLGTKAASDGDVEHEIQLDEDRIVDSSPSRRRMTISFSSPIASIIQDLAAEDIDSLEDDEGSFVDPEFIVEDSNRSKYQSLTKAARRTLLQPRPRTAPARGPSRQFSLRGQSFVPRPVSRIDERDEDSVIEANADERQISILADNSALSQVSREKQDTSLSFIIKTPGKTRMGGLYADASAIISHNVGNLSLSPMSDFTMNHHEKSFGFEVSYIVEDQRLVTGNGSKKVLSMTVRDLVDRLTEIEPFEPYWEDFTELDISERRVSSLHMLDEFCGRLVSLDASNNTLCHLDGVPASVRQLKMTHNMLTELTSWDHLANLQYVDISNNDLSSLSALKNLVHLRSLRADNNKLTSLDGLNQHDGLLTLRARNNLIEVADFEGTKLHRLTELDLAGNKVAEIRNAGQLSSLQTLKLAKNRLESFTAEDAQCMDGLRHLDISDNDVLELDISRLPAIRLLHADRNRISKMTGFSKARHLDSLSLREQRSDIQLDLSFLSSAYEVRKLFLSGNYIGTFEPKVDFLNLQLLELANCGLRCLPEGVGQLMPNLRSLNLNFNAIADFSPIRFIPRLKKLLAAGNRLSDSTTVTELLTDFPHLTQLDLRDNPITQGFYPPVHVTISADRGHVADPFTLPEANPERDAVFARRLDETTRLRRRLYQVVFVGCCKKLKLLDGLPVKRQHMLARDPSFQALVKEGLLPSDVAQVPTATSAAATAATAGPVEYQATEEAPELAGFPKPKKTPASAPVQSPVPAFVSDEADESSSRWNAEDSFA